MKASYCKGLVSGVRRNEHFDLFLIKDGELETCAAFQKGYFYF